MTDLAEKLLKVFYEFWQDPNWPYAKTRPVPGIFIAPKAGIVSKNELGGWWKTPCLWSWISSERYSVSGKVLVTMIVHTFLVNDKWIETADRI